MSKNGQIINRRDMRRNMTVIDKLVANLPNSDGAYIKFKRNYSAKRRVGTYSLYELDNIALEDNIKNFITIDNLKWITIMDNQGLHVQTIIFRENSKVYVMPLYGSKYQKFTEGLFKQANALKKGQ